MKQAVRWVGDLAAMGGIGLCLLSGLTRISGSYVLMGMDAIAIFTGGTGLMVLACLAKLHQIQNKQS